MLNKSSEYHRNHRYGKIWKAVWTRDEGKCVLCFSNKNLALDHIIPVSKEGRSTLDNLRVLCQSCNTTEGQAGRELNSRLEKQRNYLRTWSKINPEYFTKKSREFRVNHKGYYREINQKQERFYMEARI